MNNLNPKVMQTICDSIAAHFGNDCEVVFHDLTLDYEHTIVAIANGHITNRSIGGPGTSDGLRALKENDMTLDSSRDIATYINQGPKGRMLKTTSTYFRNESGKIIASLCINQDISDMLYFQSQLNALLSLEKNTGEKFANDISDILEGMINEAVSSVAKPVERMSRDDKIAVIRYLDRHGAFLVKRSVERVCVRLDISRNSFYAYLEEGRDGRSE